MQTLRIVLVFTSLVSLLVSTIYLFFILPHTSWMPAVPDWQELAPKLMSQLHKDTDWQAEDGDLMLLVCVTNLVGSIGYDRSNFNTKVSPYWSTMLTTSSLFSLVMVLANLMLLWYLLCNYRLSSKVFFFTSIFCLVLNVMMLHLMMFWMVWMLVDLNRLEMEHMMGKGNYAMVLTVVVVTLLYHSICILAGGCHMMGWKVRQDRGREEYE